jgi:hypothetical protein
MTTPEPLICSKTTRQRSRRSNAWLVGRLSKSSFLKGSEKRTAAEIREYIRHYRPNGLTIAEGCRLMGLSRATYYDKPSSPADDGGIVAAMIEDSH